MILGAIHRLCEAQVDVPLVKNVSRAISSISVPLEHLIGRGVLEKVRFKWKEIPVVLKLYEWVAGVKFRSRYRCDRQTLPESCFVSPRTSLDEII